MASAPKGKTIIDLSQPLTTTGGSYCNGHPHFTCERICNIAAHGSNVSHISFGSHTGTHVDAPVHFFDTGASIGEVDISHLVGPALVVDVRGRNERDVIGWDAFAEYEGRIKPGLIVLLCTGWAKYWGEAKYEANPRLDIAVAKKLGELGVNVLGIDTLSPDGIPLAGEKAVYDVHLEVLGRGGVIVENLNNLEELMEVKDPIVSLLPLRLDGSDGSPIRAVGWPASESESFAAIVDCFNAE